MKNEPRELKDAEKFTRELVANRKKLSIADYGVLEEICIAFLNIFKSSNPEFKREILEEGSEEFSCATEEFEYYLLIIRGMKELKSKR